MTFSALTCQNLAGDTGAMDDNNIYIYIATLVWYDTKRQKIWQKQ